MLRARRKPLHRRGQETQTLRIDASLGDAWTTAFTYAGSPQVSLRAFPGSRPHIGGMHRTFQNGSTFSTLLMNLHTAKRRLIVRIDEAKRLGEFTADLEHELNIKKGETKAFMAYLQAHQ